MNTVVGFVFRLPDAGVCPNPGSRDVRSTPCDAESKVNSITQH
jgi:hypothetical protein